MTILDQEKLNQFFKNVSAGFAATPEQILLFFGILAVILLFFVFFYIIQRRRVYRKLATRSAKVYKELIGRHNLSGSEVNLIERMAEFLPPEKKKYLLLTNQHLFTLCAAKLQAVEWISEPLLASLRLKLGFPAAGPEEIPSSSVELPPGRPVLVAAPGRRGVPGRISSRDSRGVTIELEGERPVLSSGTAVRIYFKNHTGIFSFSSSIVSAGGNVVTALHSEAIKRYQRRSYYRRKVFLSVFVRSLHSRAKPYRTTLLDLGGGGASLGNPRRLFTAGNVLELTLSSSASNFRVPARVVRTSKHASVLHVQFESIPESVRDRIIGSLYRGIERPSDRITEL